MKPQELRIGNIIQDINSKITRLLPNRCSYKRGEINIYSLEYDKINPVELTESLLFKFDFKKGVVYGYENENIQINNIRNQYFIIYFYTKIIARKIKFVHELQNIFFELTGKELTIKKE